MKPFVIEASRLRYAIPKMDCHLHSYYTDGKASLNDYVEAAVGRQFTIICFTEHVNRTTTWYDCFHDEVRLLRNKVAGRIELYHGIEVRAIDYQGHLNASPELVSKAEIVVGVVHSYPTVGEGVYRLDEVDMQTALGLEYKTTMGLLENGNIDVLGHPGRTFEEHFGRFPLEIYREIILKAKDKQIAIELNPKHQRDFRAFVNICLDANVLVSLGSDAHHVSELGRSYEELREILLECH